MSYAGGGTDSRSCHMFITLSPAGSDSNYGLGGANHETVFAMVIDGAVAWALNHDVHVSTFSEIAKKIGLPHFGLAICF